ncbi:MAG: transposase, partial [Caldilineaceae bacterium]
MAKQSRRQYTEQFKREAVKLVKEQGRGVADVSRSLGVHRAVKSSAGASGMDRHQRRPGLRRCGARRPRSSSGCGPMSTMPSSCDRENEAVLGQLQAEQPPQEPLPAPRHRTKQHN